MFSRCNTILLLSLLLVAPIGTPHAGPPSDTAALAGLETGRGVFLVDISQPKKLAFYLEAIQGTHAGMARQGVTPDFVMVYIGPSVSYLTTQPQEEIAFEYEDTLTRIARAVTALDELGIRQEICAVATEAFKVDNDKVLPELKVVADGFVSVIGYQARGYGLVPVY